jgi:hypothetical protein
VDLSTITVADFKARFYRDFTYSEANTNTIPAITDPDFVQSQDIENAFTDAKALFNQSLLPDDDAIRAAYLYLTAHCMCLNIRAANDGINSPGQQPVNSRSVGSVSESYTIPTEYTENPILAGYTATSYGLKYLQMVLPYMVGNVVGVFGITWA